MNAIVIISDTLRRDHLSCYQEKVLPPGPELGPPYSIYAPHLTKLGNQSFVFDHAYLASFPTVPNRNDIMTGRYTFTYKPWIPLGSDEVVLSETLNKAGIMTALFVDTPHPFAPGYNYQRGFQAWDLIRGQEGDTWKTSDARVDLPADPAKFRGRENVVTRYLQNVSERLYEADYFPARTMTAAARWLEKNYRRPFFLYVDTFDPHEPWDPPEHYIRKYMSDYRGEKAIYPRYDQCGYLSAEELRYCRALYAGEVSLVDHWVGHLLQRVEDLGLADDTLVIFSTDHGFYLGEHGYIGKSIISPKYQQGLALYSEIVNIPFLLRMPGQTGSRRIGGYAQPVDIMPTVLDYFGVEVPATVQGSSLLPLINGEQSQVRSFCVSSPTISGPHVKVPHPTNRLTITAGEWALIFGSQVDENIDELEYTHMVDSIRRQIRLLEKPPIRPELYHLASDPTCTRNVLKENIDVAKGLHRELCAFLQRTGVEPRHMVYFDAFPEI